MWTPCFPGLAGCPDPGVGDAPGAIVVVTVHDEEAPAGIPGVRRQVSPAAAEIAAVGPSTVLPNGSRSSYVSPPLIDGQSSALLAGLPSPLKYQTSLASVTPQYVSNAAFDAAR